MSIAHDLAPAAPLAPRGLTFPRAGGLGAALFVVGSVVGNEVLGGAGDAPGVADTSAAIAQHLAANPPTSTQWAGLYVEVLALLALAVFGVALWQRLRAADPGRPWLAVLAGGGIGLAVAIKLASLPAAFAAWYRADDGLDPSVATALLDLNAAAFALMWAPLGVALIATGASAVRSGALPRLLAGAACVIGVALLANLPLFAQEFVPAFLLTLLWLLATSVAMVRRA